MFEVQIAGELSGVIETRHATTARKVALSLAREHKRDVTISSGGKVRIIITATGQNKPPADMQADAREGCVRDSDRTCFCTACRTERRRQR